jgi:hypothetical protein
MKTRGSFERGVAIISIDTEQIWGHFDLVNERQFRESYPQALEIHDRLLNLLSREGISATWTVVGALSLPGTAGAADSCFSGLPGYWTEAIPCGDEESKPLWYRRSFVRRLRSASTPQDIGMHGGISHLVWGDPRTTAALAAKELAAGMRALRELQIEPDSFVFPRDLEAHYETLREGGIRCYRGRAPILSEQFGYSRTGSVVRAIEELCSLTPPVVWPKEVMPGLWNIPASMFIYNLRAGRSRIVRPSLRVQRTKLGLEAAARQKGVFHLGLHPENLAQSDFAFSVFESMVDEICRFRDRGEIETMSMAGTVNRVAGTKKSVEKMVVMV